MKKVITVMLSAIVMASMVVPAIAAEGEAAISTAEMTAEEQAWWDAYEIPEDMDGVELYPDDQIELREKNYETVCRFMQGLSPYLYLLYADDVVTGVAYDFSQTEDAMRNSDIEFQKMLDASNAESYPDWAWENIKVYQSDDPNVFMIECDGHGTYMEDGEAVRTHTDHYLHKFTMEDGLIKEYIEFNNPCQELLEMGFDVPMPGGDIPEGDGDSEGGENAASEGGASEDSESAESENAEPAELTEDEQAWLDAFEIPEGMENIALYPDDQIELREKNYEVVCMFMQGLSPYLYLTYTDDIATGVAYDFGGTTNPFNPILCNNMEMQKMLDASNAESYDGWEWTNMQVYQSDDPNVFLVECDGACATHSDHYVHEFICRDGKIQQYIEFNSPMNELIEGGYEVPDFR